MHTMAGLTAWLVLFVAGICTQQSGPVYGDPLSTPYNLFHQQDPSDTIPDSIVGACGAAYNNSLFIFGGMMNSQVRCCKGGTVCIPGPNSKRVSFRPYVTPDYTRLVAIQLQQSGVGSDAPGIDRNMAQPPEGLLVACRAVQRPGACPHGLWWHDLWVCPSKIQHKRDLTFTFTDMCAHQIPRGCPLCRREAIKNDLFFFVFASRLWVPVPMDDNHIWPSPRLSMASTVYENENTVFAYGGGLWNTSGTVEGLFVAEVSNELWLFNATSLVGASCYGWQW